MFTRRGNDFDLFADMRKMAPWNRTAMSSFSRLAPEPRSTIFLIPREWFFELNSAYSWDLMALSMTSAKSSRSNREIFLRHGSCATTRCTIARSYQTSEKARIYLRFRGDSPFMSGKASRRSLDNRSMNFANSPSFPQRKPAECFLLSCATGVSAVTVLIPSPRGLRFAREWEADPLELWEGA